MGTALTTPTITVCFYPTPNREAESDGSWGTWVFLSTLYTIWVSIHTKSIVLSSFLAFLTLSDLPTILTTPTTVRETPSPPLKLNLNGNYPPYPNYLRFLEGPHPHSYHGFIL